MIKNCLEDSMYPLSYNPKYKKKYAMMMPYIDNCYPYGVCLYGLPNTIPLIGAITVHHGMQYTPPFVQRKKKRKNICKHHPKITTP